MEVAHRNDDLTHCAHGVHVAVREWVVCAVDVVEHGSNPERSMAPGGSTISDPDKSMGLFVKVVNISSLCCHVLLHHLFNILEFNLTPASINSPVRTSPSYISFLSLGQATALPPSLRRKSNALL